MRLRRRAWSGISRDGRGVRGTSWRSQLLLKPVGVVADVLVHVADGNIKRASRFAPEVVPPGDIERLRLAVGQTGLTGVEPTEELRQLVHQFKPKHRKLFLALKPDLLHVKLSLLCQQLALSVIK